jgi:Leucine-rich repeat (LRR) protein
MINGVTIEEGVYGKRAVVTSAWSEEMADYLLACGIAEIELNDGKGWRGSDVSFLSRFPQLLSFKIIDLKINSIGSIHFLTSLRALEVITYCTTEIEFAAFPHLEQCALVWRPKACSLFDCATLNKLFIDNYDGKDVSSLSKLTNLEVLAILNAPVEDLLGIGALKKLRSLRLGNLARLTSLRGIDELASLEELEIHTCKRIASVDEVGNLSRLKKLHLNNDGNIASLKPLDRLCMLETVLFYESTNILDGDISPLARQNNLRRVSFQNRRHYSLRREEFE